MRENFGVRMAKNKARIANSSEATKKSNTVHGQSRTDEYKIWCAMRKRCTVKSNKSYSFYGGRGIRVCAEWENDVFAFVRDVGIRPSKLHTLDRYPDPDGNYEPGNVRWATRKEQARNTRNCLRLTIDNVTKSAGEWAEIYGKKPGTITDRLRRGWSHRDAVTVPVAVNFHQPRNRR